MPPKEVRGFGQEVAGRLRGLLGADLVGCYFGGSAVLGGYVSGQSDIDIIGVVARRIDRDEKHAVVRELAHPNVRCPTRGLEFELYHQAVVRTASPAAAFELDLNTGPGMEQNVELDSTTAPRFWFVLNRAVVQRHGIAISGPSPASLFAEIPRRWLLEAMAESMAWHRAHERLGHYSVLNACRAWRFAETDVLGSKLDGATWTRERWPTPETIDLAMDRRYGGDALLTAAQINELLDHVAGILARCLLSDGPAV